MCKKIYVAANKPEYKAVLNALLEHQYAGNHDIVVTTCKKANKIVIEGERLLTVYKVCNEVTGCGIRGFYELWKTA